MRWSFLCLSGGAREPVFNTSTANSQADDPDLCLWHVKLLFIMLMQNNEQDQQNYLANWITTVCFLENKKNLIISQGQSDTNI